MKKIDNFISCYGVSKTLRFKLIPVGKTQDNIDQKRLIEEDKKRAADYKAAKKIIDRYHISFIDEVLSDVKLEGLEEYESLFHKGNRSEEEDERFSALEASFRKQIAGAFSSNKKMKEVLFTKNLIRTELPGILTDEEEKRVINSFFDFTTAFNDFHKNRKNIYSEEAKSSSIAYRIVNENLPKFISNMNCFRKIRWVLDEQQVKFINESVLGNDYYVDDLFKIEAFNWVLNQKGIDIYNSVLGASCMIQI